MSVIKSGKKKTFLIGNTLDCEGGTEGKIEYFMSRWLENESNSNELNPLAHTVYQSDKKSVGISAYLFSLF